jgi:L-seryl-tRNA(Ser) seleniumtransferase
VKAPSREKLRLLPAVERVLTRAEVVPLCAQYGRAVVTDWIRRILRDLRDGRADDLPDNAEAVEEQVMSALHQVASSATSHSLREVINATGIVIHTNLGRAPLAQKAIEALAEVAACTNLEVDLASGQRGTRGAAIEQLWRELTGAEAALVVNNCAAATLLTLQTMAAGRRVIISRGQLIEIGGSFRLPDVFRQAGVELHEVGTTNRTRLSDFAEAIGPQTAALLRVHPSNYRISGFCEAVPIADLVELGRKHHIPVIDDVGSGCLYDLARYGLPDEPIVSESLRAGADLVIFSGDKLLGGPQCGIILGGAEVVAKLRSNPLARALRVDKLTLAALEATLQIHRAERASEEIPVLRQLKLADSEIRGRAERLVEELRKKSPRPDKYSLQAVASAPGGGSLPGSTLSSWAIAIESPSADHVARQLRLGRPAVFARVQDRCTLLDLRTVRAEDEDRLIRRILECSLE